MSRKFKVKGKIREKESIGDVDRIFNQIRKYGVDTEDKDTFYFDFKGNIAIRDMIAEQTESVLRTFWNHNVDVLEVTELDYNGEGDDYDLFVMSKTKPFSIGSFMHMFEEYIAGKYFITEDESEDESEDDEEEEE